MAKKSKTVFVCQSCGYESPRWMGQCTCGTWNSMVEEIEDKGQAYKKSPTLTSSSKPQFLKAIQSSTYDRLDTHIGELNRVLGGGLVKGSLTLISGEPGIGKSTLILQASSTIGDQYGTVLYVSGEESEEQIKMRAERLRAVSDRLMVVSETNIDVIENYIEELNPVFIVIDSIQTLFKPDLTSAPGSVSQVRECANNLMRIGKTKDIPIFIVAHVTKTGELAGPRILEHLVDTVLHFTGERTAEFRMVRAVKNRFGTTSEVGVFEMKEEGLVEVGNPSAIFLEGLTPNVEGAIAICSLEGTRPLLVEIQALVAPTNLGFARRTAIGIDLNRLNLIIAVLEKKVGLPLTNQDVYVNVVGGLKLEGTSSDLGVALAIYSSMRGLPIPTTTTMAIGEISLTGELRPVSNGEKMIKEAAKMGFQKCILPGKSGRKLQINDPIQLFGADSLKDAIAMLFKPE
ncbi:DNA repair protein RadA/Sms [Anaerosolibacter carboniphilus]|uniref:DNA repair protein RadA n=1 Tax=Anaerosolibacter carboniphilus TaxID=1417629 RepID=A0A841KZJ8_9FIRM|nr:DNA repair protein RadA [Anaerosolibacter carboniphilus]MBB6217400.1 DNA repair protein RadA/Sms [Anaerosolibacter carboniphilus]